MSLIITHNAGFFSCCTVKLRKIIKYINTNNNLPEKIYCSEQFNLYKENSTHDITYVYFEHYENTKNIIIDKIPIVITNSKNEDQFSNYNELNYEELYPIIYKYFFPSIEIINIIQNIVCKYNIDYNNTCVLFYRGNDKSRETPLCKYNEYITYANIIIKENPNIKFLIQSDVTEFIELMQSKYYLNSFILKDEIRHMKNRDSSVDIVMRSKNFQYSKYYLAITIIMSKCKYIICNSGNCSYWIMLYRGNSNNVYQNLNNKWIINN